MDMAEAGQLAKLRGIRETGVAMARHVSWRAGGRADRAYTPADADDLAAYLRTLDAGEPLLFVGLGSNLLVRDGGFRGTVVFLHGTLNELALDGDLIRAGAGVASPKLARFAANHGRGGAEFLAGIPGTVGGALAMNAGCYGGETWAIVDRVVSIDRQGVFRTRTAADFDIGYRHVALRAAREEWFVAAWFRLPAADTTLAREKIRGLLERRIATQPLQLPNAGSVFRNPPGDHAARLIEAAGLKGVSRGGAQVSTRHANFIVNADGRASAADIEGLIETVRETVRSRFGIDLVREVRIVGDAVAPEPGSDGEGRASDE